MIDLQRILVPIDFSKHSQNALSYAMAFAENSALSCICCTSSQDLALFVPDAVAVAPPIAPPIEQFTAAARQALDRLVQGSHFQKLTVHQEVREGAPFYEIIRFAQETDIDLIVLGTHGHSGLVHMLLGSVAEKVVRKAPCPVLTVRHPEHEFVHP